MELKEKDKLIITSVRARESVLIRLKKLCKYRGDFTRLTDKALEMVCQVEEGKAVIVPVEHIVIVTEKAS